MLLYKNTKGENIITWYISYTRNLATSKALSDHVDSIGSDQHTRLQVASTARILNNKLSLHYCNSLPLVSMKLAQL